MELRVFSRDAVEQYVPDRVEVCISISDPDVPPARLSPGFAAVLRLYFSDIVEAVSPEDVLFAPEHAAAIVEFMDRWRDAERLFSSKAPRPRARFPSTRTSSAAPSTPSRHRSGFLART